MAAAGLVLTRFETEEEVAVDATMPQSKEAKKRRSKVKTKTRPSLGEEESDRGIKAVEEVQKMFTEDKTTVMVRNIPSCYNCEELLGEILAGNFDETINFFYLPIDFNTKRNRGYCFLNFRSSHWAREFVRVFHGQSLTRYCTKKILEIAPAVTQGLENNMRCFKRCKPRVKNIWFRPIVFGLDEEEYRKICESDD